MRKTKWGDFEERIPIPTFGGYVINVVFTPNMQVSAKHRFGYVPIRMRNAEFAKAFHKVHDEDGEATLFFPMDPKPEYIAHESWHAIRYMLEDWAGASLENETVAYHLGYLVGIIHELKSKVEEVANATKDAQGEVSRLQRLHTPAGQETPGT